LNRCEGRIRIEAEIQKRIDIDLWNVETEPRMPHRRLVKIGEPPKLPTISQFLTDMATRQHEEIERLKSEAATGVLPDPTVPEKHYEELTPDPWQLHPVRIKKSAKKKSVKKASAKKPTKTPSRAKASKTNKKVVKAKKAASKPGARKKPAKKAAARKSRR
jgi:hypothetical protein